MSLLDGIKPGDICPMHKCDVVYGNDVKMSYASTGRGKKRTRMVFLFLGSEDDDKPLDPDARLRALGWKPEDE